jgi:hypothetical protein
VEKFSFKKFHQKFLSSVGRHFHKHRSLIILKIVSERAHHYLSFYTPLSYLSWTFEKPDRRNDFFEFSIYLENFLWNISKFFLRNSTLAHGFRIYKTIFEIRKKKFFFRNTIFFWGSRRASNMGALTLSQKFLSIFARFTTKFSIIIYLELEFWIAPSGRSLHFASRSNNMTRYFCL